MISVIHQNYQYWVFCYLFHCHQDKLSGLNISWKKEDLKINLLILSPLLFYSLPSFDFSIVFKLGTGFRSDLLLSLELSVLDAALVSFAAESLEELSEKLPLPPSEILFPSKHKPEDQTFSSHTYVLVDPQFCPSTLAFILRVSHPLIVRIWHH